ncbi:type IV secretory system conjugative DNA transfer family protein [Anaeromyxobacter diazotrophicus]|nr:type IV secretory system conjugative DNA transfer family protein [Anaeromyxobacter diazotrophicus]
MTPRSRHPRALVVATVGLFACIMAVLAASAAITAYVAHRFRYHPALGRPWFGHVYAPWGWVSWAFDHDRAAPKLFASVQVVFVAFVLLAGLAHALFYGLSVRSTARHAGRHGTAHFASRREIEATGLLAPCRGPRAGVYVGAWREEDGTLRYLRHDGPEHIVAIAPTRSGKGVGLVVPTLLSWPGSVIAHDLKGELWELTAGWRSRGGGNVVVKFDPAAPSGSSAFNPLEEIRLGSLHEVADVQNLVTILVDPDGKGLVDHWAKTAHALLTGVVLHLAFQARASGRPATLADLALALSDPEEPVDRLYQAMLANEHLEGGAQHPVIAAAARDMLNRPAEERGSVLSSAMSYLSIYRDPLVARNTSHSDFRIADLMDHERPVSLYLVVRPADKDRLRPLMRLVVNQIVRVLVREGLRFEGGEPVPPHKHRMLLMLDEFPSFGRLEVFQEALAYLGGYGIKAYIVMQDLAQLWGAYGREESIISNCHVRIAYAPNKLDTAEWLSRMTGTATVVTEDFNMSGQRFAALLGHVSRTVHESKRPLLTPDECMRLRAAVKDPAGRITDPGEVLVFVAGHSPIAATQILYFRDPVFERRARMPAPSSGIIRPAPFVLSGAAREETRT